METVFKLFLLIIFCSRLHAAKKTPYCPLYHLTPPKGWMNDPNGFCYFNGEYHLFYQYNPYSSLKPGIAHWGQAKSKDLFHWVDLPIAMYPDSMYDAQGVFSGSAVVDNNVMYLFYTGNVNTAPYHNQYQAIANSTDGVIVNKFEGNPIIKISGLQPDLRDPKVSKHGNDWYMVLGNSFNNLKLGRILLFKSSNMFNWSQVAVLGKSDGLLGYMWECPDFFELDGHFILLFSPQGVQEQGDRYKNLYQTVYIVGDFDYTTHVFTPITKFRELDFGHDFYATQTILDDSGRRLLIAWLDMWNMNYPEIEYVTGQMTMIRKLSLTTDNLLIQAPVHEINLIRNKKLFEGNSSGGTTINLPDNAGEVYIIAPRTKRFTLYIESVESDTVTIEYDYLHGKVSLDRGGSDGLRRIDYRPVGKLELRIFIDASSVEVFYGNGIITFSSRFFPNREVKVRLGSNSQAKLLVAYSMNKTLYVN